MAATPSTMVEIGTPAPEFSLPDPSGRVHRLSDFEKSPVLVVAFLCNHCPFVKHIQRGLTAFTNEYADRGVAVVAINANDVENYPDDAPEKMADEAKAAGYRFPYLYDETQEVAKAYRAACTPDFFIYDRNRRLAYRGQFDESRPKTDVPVTGRDLRAAVDALLEGGDAPGEQHPSIGCNIKWKPGNAPEYFQS